ncbi:hypothetical protein Leryth_014795 [Lithospermum erythrorhizon]|nr:hypothetical protein Leryth_014795 [Lithospermum erythrorhizon]
MMIVGRRSSAQYGGSAISVFDNQCFDVVARSKGWLIRPSVASNFLCDLLIRMEKEITDEVSYSDEVSYQHFEILEYRVRTLLNALIICFSGRRSIIHHPIYFYRLFPARV